MSYHHLTTFERGRIQELSSLGLSNREIAKKLNRHHSSISRELSRNSIEGKYRGESAQIAYEQRRLNSVPAGKYDKTLCDVISEKLQATWSPEQISNTITAGKICFKTIYRWIYQGLLPDIDVNHLRHKGKRKKAEKRGKFSMGTPISQRPKEVKSRETFGHWELDSMVSSRGESKGCFATFVERKSRLYTAIKMADRTATSMQQAITSLFHTLPSGAFLTGTTDRGKEFACHQAVKDELDVTLYFADPYCSWQRGSNENSNGLLREFYPKKTDLATVPSNDLAYYLMLINSRPRKCLGWKSPIQVFLHELAHLA